MENLGGGYSRLDPLGSEIRLLILDPATDIDSPIECAIRTVSLNENPAYEALSYAWGDPTVVESIRLGGKEVTVPYSSWTALKALRYVDKHRTIWIDAICINQDDLEERAAQVKLMGRIYQGASSVRVWLGPDNENDLNAIPILREMREPEAARKTLHDPRVSRGRIEHLECFFKRQWWERLWVVQEVALGRRVIFQLGSTELDFEHLLDAYRITDKYFRENLMGYNYGAYSGNDADFMELFKCVQVLHQARALYRAQIVKDAERLPRHAIMTWITLLNLLRVRKAMIDNDRLYSLYGLLPPDVVQLPGMQPSYSMTTERVFTDVTYTIMEASRSLMTFNFLGLQQTSEPSRLPSWVPDWRRPPKDQYEANLRVARESLFDASKGAPFYIKRLSTNTLCLKGCFIDVVQRWTPKPLFSSASPMLQICYMGWRDTWRDAALVSGFPLQDLSPLSLENSFRTTVLYGCELGREEGTLNRLTGSEGRAMWAAHDRAVAIACGEDDEFLGQKLSDTDARRTEYMLNCAKGRTFFATSSLFMGMTQATLEPGDHVFIVSGNSHPVILRPSRKFANTWRAVGECFLNSFMDGKGLDNRDIFEAQLEHINGQEPIKAIKGTERNPAWDKVEGKAGGPWKWLLVE